MNRYNESFFIDENSNLLGHYACNRLLPDGTMKDFAETEAKLQMQFPSEMTAYLTESPAGAYTVLWTDTIPGEV